MDISRFHFNLICENTPITDSDDNVVGFHCHTHDVDCLRNGWEKGWCYGTLSASDKCSIHNLNYTDDKDPYLAFLAEYIDNMMYVKYGTQWKWGKESKEEHIKRNDIYIREQLHERYEYALHEDKFIILYASIVGEDVESVRDKILKTIWQQIPQQ